MKHISYNAHTFKKTSYYTLLPKEEQEIFNILSGIFHFKVNNYVLEHLIDWQAVPQDPIYRLVFPRKDMLPATDFNQVQKLYQLGLKENSLLPYLKSLQQRMSPQVKHYDDSTPTINGVTAYGVYHTFRSILNLSPSSMTKTCHAYCSYCFRWIFFEEQALQKNVSYVNPDEPVPYLETNPQITDVLFSGADPLVIGADNLREYIEPLLKVPSLQTIRISSKALAWWPFRFTTDKDANQLLRLFEDVGSKGKKMCINAHFTHPRELEHEAVHKATQRIRATGTSIYSQGPLVYGINDTPEDWINLWTQQIHLDIIPYYMFVEANHHPENCFRLPLAESLRIFQEAQKRTTGLARTVRGPVFVNDLNRILLDGTTELNGQKHFVLKTLQCPPGLKSEGDIKLIPYNEHTKEVGDLFELFNS